MSLREDILKAEDLPRERVHVDEWNVDVWVRTLRADEWDMVSRLYELTPVGRPRNIVAQTLVRALVDEKGVRIFGDGDVDQLAAKAQPVLSRLYDIAARLNRIGKAEQEADLKNSDAAPSAS